MKKVVFVDRDGTIVYEPPDCQVDSLEKLEFRPGMIRGLRLLLESGYELVLVSNQDGLGTESYPRRAFQLVQKKILGVLEGEGVHFSGIFICPHLREQNCDCRKPKVGLVKDFLKRNRIDKGHSFVLGDRLTDIAFAHNLGIRSVRITGGAKEGKSPYSSLRAELTTGDPYEACLYIARASRSATVGRKTRETEIVASIVLDGSGMHQIRTGLRFFDHMLAQLSKHSGVDLKLTANGDLEVDEHHTVEDVGIVLGEAFRKALSDKRGIERFAAPLDESLAEVAVDLGGRSYLVFDCAFQRERVGDLPTELVEHFFRSFADGLGATIHIRCRGRNEHHKIEAIFKSTARALKQAIRIDRRSGIPSTKGRI